MRGLAAVPSISFEFNDWSMPEVVSVKVTADSQSVVIAYLNIRGNALEVREFAVREHDELRDIVKVTYFDDVWDIDLVLSLVEIVDPQEPCGTFMPLVPAYLQSLQAAV